MKRIKLIKMTSFNFHHYFEFLQTNNNQKKNGKNFFDVTKFENNPEEYLKFFSYHMAIRD